MTHYIHTYFFCALFLEEYDEVQMIVGLEQSPSPKGSYIFRGENSTSAVVGVDDIMKQIAIRSDLN